MGLPPGMAAGEVSQLGFIFVYIYSCCLLWVYCLVYFDFFIF
jgi:hypothetical protein